MLKDQTLQNRILNNLFLSVVNRAENLIIMKRLILSIALILYNYVYSLAQQNSGVIKGRVYNSKTNEGVPFATVQIWGTTTGAIY